MKLLVYCKKLKNRFEVKHFGINKKETNEFFPLKDCLPYIPSYFLKDIKNYALHPVSLNLKQKAKKIRVKIGFFHKKDELLFSLIVKNNLFILNPIIIEEEYFFSNSHSITIHNDGKRVLKHSFYPNKRELDFYTLIDKIFTKFFQFDAIFDKKLVISFRKEER